LAPGSTFGPYTLVGRIGSGGMAELFLAERRGAANVSKRVAIKVILPHLGRDSGYVEMFLDEARVAARLDHPNIVHIFDFGETDGRYFLAMEYLAGVTLSELAARLRNDRVDMPVDVALQIGVGICRGLHYAHEFAVDGQPQGIVHRDVTPSNVMLGLSGAVKLLDFGIARSRQRVQERTETGVVKGKLSYCAPEQLDEAPQDRRVDIWAMGVIMHELLTGARLFRRETDPKTIRAVLDGPIPPTAPDREDIPDALRELIARCLDRDRDRRPESALALRRSFEALLTGARTPLDDFVRDLFPDGVDFPGSEAPTIVDPVTTGGSSDPSLPEGSDTRGPAPTTEVTELPKTEGTTLGRRRWLGWVGGGAVVAAVASAVFLRQHGDELGEIERIIQRGELERGRIALDAYLDEHPDDGRALLMRVLVQWWATAPKIDDAVHRARQGPLDEVETAALEGVVLVNSARYSEAERYLQPFVEKYPDRPELRYVLGEAQWHRHALRDGAQTLLQTVELDPTWQMALHHPMTFYLDQRRPEALEPIVQRLRTDDPVKAVELEAALLMNRNLYDQARTRVREALDEHPGEAILWARLAEIETLREDWVAAEEAASRASQEAPLDNREAGGAALWAEHYLYRGQFTEFRQSLNPVSRTRITAEALWRDTLYGEVLRPPMDHMRNPPFFAATYFIHGALQDRDDSDVYEGYPEPDIAAFGEGIALERAGKLEAAAAAYERGLSVPQTGETRMLLAHHLARTKVAAGDLQAAAEACDEVLHPRVYFPYRAIFWPDCVLWTGKALEATSPQEARAHYHRLSEAFRGEFEHPAVREARKLLK
jgi:serine/threonine protein kinase/tetratricopeptide (TPR) repeat protein